MPFMQAAIHPKWQQATVTCACGNTFTVGTTVPSIHVEVCSACHPFYTGQMKYVDTKGRVDSFLNKQAAAKTDRVSKNARRAAKREAEIAKDIARPDTLSALRKTIRENKAK